jgi:hypothetical protein
MIALPVSPEGSRTAALGGDRRRSDGLRRVLLLLAIALTVMAGPLGRPAAEQPPSEDTFRPVTVTSSTVAAQAR